jgi:hypothetical protein
MTMAKKTHGRTASGVPITDDLVAELGKKAEAGYDVDEMLRRRGGRPHFGTVRPAARSSSASRKLVTNSGALART